MIDDLNNEITEQTEAVLSHYLRALCTGGEEILRDYTDESILFTPDGSAKGLIEIGRLFANIPVAFQKAFKLLHQDINGEWAYIVWTAPPFVLMGTDTFVIQGKKIQLQTHTTYSLY